MNRKRKLYSEGASHAREIINSALIYPINPTVTEKIVLISGYNCSSCGYLPAHCFSKSKINQLCRNKLTNITCSDCTLKLVALDKSNKKSAKVFHVNRISEGNTVKNVDPSLQYSSNPCQAPLVIDAITYFQKRSMLFKVYVGPSKGWRTVAKLAVRSTFENSFDPSKNSGVPNDRCIKTSIGLFEPGTHNVITNSSNSPAHHPSINQVVRLVSKICHEKNIHGYMEGSGVDIEQMLLYKTYLKYLIMAVERKTNCVQLSLVWNTESEGTNLDGDKLLKELIDELLKYNLTCEEPHKNEGGGESKHVLFHSIWVNYNPSSKHNNAISGRGTDAWKLFYGKPYITEVVVTDMVKPPKLRFPPTVFRQANIDAFQNIIQNIRYHIKMFRQSNTSQDECTMMDNHNSDLRCVELYGGVGTIGLNCLDLFSYLQCSDENPHNLISFNKTLNKMSKTFRQRAIYDPKSASTVVNEDGLKGYDIVIVDPPRKGLDDDVIEALLDYSVECSSDLMNNNNSIDSNHEYHCAKKYNKRLIYVSCGFTAFKRDLSRLTGEDQQYSLNDNGGGGGHQREIRHWQLVHAEGHILFPGADHIEILAIFDRVI